MSMEMVVSMHKHVHSLMLGGRKPISMYMYVHMFMDV